MRSKFIHDLTIAIKENNTHEHLDTLIRPSTRALTCRPVGGVCSSVSTAQPTVIATSQPTAIPTSQATATPTSPLTATPVVGVLNCGSIATGLGAGPDSTSQELQHAEHCFWQAYQQCHPATLKYDVMNTDGDAKFAFTIEHASGSCSISDHENAVGNSGTPTVNTYVCPSMTQKPDGLHITCTGESEIVIPSQAY